MTVANLADEALQAEGEALFAQARVQFWEYANTLTEAEFESKDMGAIERDMIAAYIREHGSKKLVKALEKRKKTNDAVRAKYLARGYILKL